MISSNHEAKVAELLAILKGFPELSNESRMRLVVRCLEELAKQRGLEDASTVKRDGEVIEREPRC